MMKLNLSMVVLAMVASANTSFANGGGDSFHGFFGEVDEDMFSMDLPLRQENDPAVSGEELKTESEGDVFLKSIEKSIFNKSATIYTVINTLFRENEIARTFATSIMSQLNSGEPILEENTENSSKDLISRLCINLFFLQEDFQAIDSQKPTDCALQDGAYNVVSSFLDMVKNGEYR